MFLVSTYRSFPRAFWCLWVGTLVNRLGAFIGPFLAIYLTNERRLPIAQAGTIVALLGVGAIGGGPIGGILADRIGRRFTVGLSTACTALAMLGLGFARSPIELAAAVVAVGLFTDMTRPAISAWIVDIVPAPDRPRAFGLHYWAVNLGFSIAPVLAGLLAGFGFTALFIGDAFTTAAFGMFIVATVKETVTGRAESSNASRPPRASILTPYRDRRFLLFTMLTTVMALVFFQLSVALPLDLQSHGVPAATYGLLISLNGLLIVVAQPFATSIVTRMPRSIALAAGAILTGVGFGMTGILPGSVAFYAASIIVWTIGEMATAPITPAIVADFSPPTMRGTYQGAFQVAYGAASLLGPMGGALLLGSNGGRALWSACCVLGVVAGIGFAALMTTIARRSTSSTVY